MVKKILLTLLSLGLLLASVFFDYQIRAQAVTNYMGDPLVLLENPSDFSLEKTDQGYLVKNSSSGRATVQIFETGIVRLAPAASMRLRLDEAARRIEIEGIDGRIWLNTINSSLATRITTSQFVIDAEPGVFDIQSEKGVTLALALRHGLEVSFLDKKIIIPEGNQGVINEAKIEKSAEVIKKLRYSKLLKEFPFLPITTPYDSWMEANIADDETQHHLYLEKSEAYIRKKGPVRAFDDASAIASFSSNFLEFKQALTFDARRKEKRLIDDTFGYFDAALFAGLVGKNQQAQERLGQFGLLEQAMQANISDPTLLTQARDARRRLVELAAPDEPLFDAKKALRTSTKPSPFERLRYATSDLMDTLHTAPGGEETSTITAAVRTFGSMVDATLKQVGPSPQREELFFEALRLNNLIRRYPVLVQEPFLKRVSMIEQTHFATLSGKEALADERQLFMLEKLGQSQSLRTRMEKDQVPFAQARGAMLFLVNEINELKPAISDTALLTDVDKTLAAFAPLVSFLQSSRAENLRGSFTENFKEFNADTQQQRLIAELLAGSTGGERISTFRREELTGEVAQALRTIGFKEVKLQLPESEDDPRVRITTATFEGKSITGLYDTVRKIFTNIIFDGEKIGPSVREANIRNFLLIKMGKLTLTQGETIESLVEPEPTESTLARVAKATLIEDLKKLNIKAEEEQIDMKDFEAGIIHVRLFELSFDIEFKTRTVRALKVQTPSGEIPVNDSFALAQLPLKVEQITRRAEFEKGREEELKKLEAPVAETPVE